MLPAVHVVQAVQDAAFDTVLKVEPAMQPVHALFVVAVQAVDARVPAGHVLQIVQGAVPDVDVLYLPAAHVKQEEPEQYLPAGQVAQASCRAPEKLITSIACVWLSNAVTGVTAVAVTGITAVAVTGITAVAVNRSTAVISRKTLTI